MTFKELVQNDLKNVFLNPSEFGEEHVVNGKKMLIIIDNHELMERQKRIQSHMDGAYLKQKLVYAAASDFEKPPVHGDLFKLDGKTYRVVDVVLEEGIYSITIEANRGRK